MDTTWGLALAVFFLLGNAFFVGAEFGLIAARRSAVELRAKAGSRSASITLGAMDRLSLMLAGAQLGITLFSLGLGAVGEPLIAHLLEPVLHNLGVADYLLHPISFAIALSIMVYLHVVIGEMVPKNLALAGPDRTALILTPVLVVVVQLFHPVINALNWIANHMLRMFGIEPKGEVASTFTADEVAGFVEESRREGLISEDEGDLLSGALKFDEHKVRAVLQPLDKAITVTTKTTPKQIEALVAQTGYSRFPVKSTRGKLLGYVHLKDVLAAPASDRTKPLAKKDIRPLGAIKAALTLRAALSEMQKSGYHIAQVVDGRGRLQGIVTLEDILEELVGEIRDEAAAAV